MHALSRLAQEFEESFPHSKRENVLFCSSGTAALAILLRAVSRSSRLRTKRGSRVLLPSIVCPQVYFAVFASGLEPAFIACDPLKNAYGLDLATLEELPARDFTALVWPHLYGCVSQVEQVRAICDRKGWLLVEDAALTFGVTYCGFPTGTLGDCGVLSFGAGKVIDAGYGGILLINDSCSAKLDGLVELIQQEWASWNEPLPQTPSDSAIEFDRFLKRVYNHSYTAFKQGTFALEFHERMKAVVDDLTSLDPKKLDRAVPVGTLARAQLALARRSEAVERWNRYFKDRQFSSVRNLLQHPQGTYWRMNVLVDPAVRHHILKTGISAGVPISSWYPPLYWMFRGATTYGSTDREVAFADQVLNLWVDGIEDWDRYMDSVGRLFSGCDSALSAATAEGYWRTGP